MSNLTLKDIEELLRKGNKEQIEEKERRGSYGKF